MARRRTRRTKKVVINRYKIGGVLLAISALYFFAYYMAPKSPLFTALSYPTRL